MIGIASFCQPVALPTHNTFQFEERGKLSETRDSSVFTLATSFCQIVNSQIFFLVRGKELSWVREQELA